VDVLDEVADLRDAFDEVPGELEDEARDQGDYGEWYPDAEGLDEHGRAGSLPGTGGPGHGDQPQPSSASLFGQVADGLDIVAVRVADERTGLGVVVLRPHPRPMEYLGVRPLLDPPHKAGPQPVSELTARRRPDQRDHRSDQGRPRSRIRLC
jgi:hypothetical protein